jgi:SET domain
MQQSFWIKFDSLDDRCLLAPKISLLEDFDEINTMDWDWYREWESTVAPVNYILLARYVRKSSYLRIPTEKDLRVLKSELQQHTMLLQFGNKSSWLVRGRVLLNLRFPELAAGDLYKALQVVEGEEKNTATILLAQACFLANSFLETLQVIDEAPSAIRSNDELRRLRRYAQEAFGIEQEEESGIENGGEYCGIGNSHKSVEKDCSGEVVTRAYPWIKPAWLSRRSNVVMAVNDSLNESSLGQCEVRKSGINNSNEDCYGVFAKKAIGTQQWLLTDETSLCAAGGSTMRCDCCVGELPWFHVKLGCCGTVARFCSYSCKSTAESTYHKPVCGKEVEYSTPGGPKSVNTAGDAGSDRLWVRVLSSIKQSLDDERESYRHPLDIPFVNQLTTMYGSTVRFSLKCDIVDPLNALQMLGVNIFTDLRFDTWVLRTIAARLETNMREDIIDLRSGYHGETVETQLLAVNTMYAYYNHSCEPNVEILGDAERQSSTLRLRAKRALRKGEELYITYLDEQQLKLNYEERAWLLAPWTGGVCNCTRCVRERATVDPESDGDFEPEDSSDDESSA